MLWTALIVIVIIFLPTIITNLGNISNGSILNSGQKTTANAGLVTVTKPIQFTCFLDLAGGNCGAATIKVYQGSSSVLLETLTASGSGVATTGNSYTTGAPLSVAISGATCTTTCTVEYTSFNVPAMDPNSAISSTNNILAVYDVTLGAWTIAVTGTGGTTFTSGTTPVSLAKFTGNTVTLTVSAGETTANAGFVSSYDQTNLLNQLFVFEVNDGGGASSSTQYATVTGFPRINKLGNTNYYQVICPDGLSGSGIGSSGAYKVVSGVQSHGMPSDAICSGALSLQTIGTVNYGGTVSFSWALAVGSLTGTNQETFQIKMFAYYDPAYFAINGNGGPNAAQQGSTFTIVISK